MPLIVRKDPRVHRPKPHIPARLLSTRQAAEYLGLSPDSLRALVKYGRLTATRLGVRRLLFDTKELDRFITAST